MAWRDRLVSRRTGEAMVSPSALLLAGAGAAVGLALGLPVVAAVAIGAGAWAVRVGVAAIKAPPAHPRPRIEPDALREPWRGFVVDALSARERFGRAVATMDPGSLRDRMGMIGERIDRGVEEAWKIARRGEQIDDALANIDADAPQRELAELRRSGETGDAADRTAEALQAQLDSAARMQAVVHEAKDQLRVMDARLDELVARAAEVSVSAGDTTDPLLAGDVNGLVQEMESLRQALEETRRGGPIDDPGQALRRAGETLPPPGLST